MTVPAIVQTAGLTFEQQKELKALLQGHMDREAKLELTKLQQAASFSWRKCANTLRNRNWS